MTRTGLKPAGDSFFFAMALVSLGVGLLGFGSSFIAGVMGGMGEVPLRLHIHGAILMAWLILLAVQAGLITYGNRQTHRILGRVGFAWFVLVLMSAASLSINSLVKPVPPVIDTFILQIFFIQLTDLTIAVVLMTLALLDLRSDTQGHRRYILMTTLALLGAAVARMPWLPGMVFEPTGPVGPLHVWHSLLFVPFVLYDLRTLGRLHRSTVIGLSLIGFFKLASFWAWHSEGWLAIARGIEAFFAPWWPVH
ncbi:MAG: hypothetical protein AAFR65_09665 [Pseudomonadota bacterium]